MKVLNESPYVSLYVADKQQQQQQQHYRQSPNSLVAQRERMSPLFKPMMPSNQSSCCYNSSNRIPREIILSESKCSNNNDDTESVASYASTTKVYHVNHTSTYNQKYGRFLKPVGRLPDGRPLLSPPRLATRSECMKRSVRLISSSISLSFSETTAGPVISPSSLRCVVGGGMEEQEQDDGGVVRKKRCLSHGSDSLSAGSSSCYQRLPLFGEESCEEAKKSSDNSNKLLPSILSKPVLKNAPPPQPPRRSSVEGYLKQVSSLSNSEFIPNHLLLNCNITPLESKAPAPLGAVVVECEEEQRLVPSSSSTVTEATSPQSFKNISLLSLIATHLMESQ